MSRIVITGASGAIGMALIDFHLNKGDEVLAILNPASTKKNNFKKFRNLEILFCDLNNYDRININGKYDIFYHLAWQGGTSRSNINININSCLQSICAAELAFNLGCKVFLGAGSQAECGNQNVPISELTICNPKSAFGISKLTAYHILKSKCEELGMSFIWARILSVYGPYDGENTLVISSIRKMLRGEKAYFSKGDQTWDFLYSSDTAELLYLITSNPESMGIYTIGSGKKIKLKEFIKLMTNKFNIDCEELLGKIKSSDLTPNYLLADLTKVNNEISWQPKIDLSEGIDRTIMYCKEVKLK